MGWTWAKGTPRERADMVRSHNRILRRADLCSLFQLTRKGAEAILKGDNWRPEHTSSYKREDDWEKPRSHGTGLAVDEIAKIKAAYIANRTIRDIARELQCASRSVSKYYGFFRAEGMVKDGDKPKRQLPARHYTSSFEPQ